MVLGTVNPQYSYSHTVALVPHARSGVKHCGSWDVGRMEGGNEVGTARRMGSVTLGSSSSPGSHHWQQMGPSAKVVHFLPLPLFPPETITILKSRSSKNEAQAWAKIISRD